MEESLDLKQLREEVYNLKEYIKKTCDDLETKFCVFKDDIYTGLNIDECADCKNTRVIVDYCECCEYHHNSNKLCTFCVRNHTHECEGCFQNTNYKELIRREITYWDRKKFVCQTCLPKTKE